jgi:hypothetical protein
MRRGALLAEPEPRRIWIERRDASLTLHDARDETSTPGYLTVAAEAGVLDARAAEGMIREL